jgi:hypothetical protein
LKGPGFSQAATVLLGIAALAAEVPPPVSSEAVSFIQRISAAGRWRTRSQDEQ